MMQGKDIYIFVLLFIGLIAFRFSTNIENIVSIGGSSIATIPWSDAAGWTEGSEYIQRGEIMPEFPSRRPLYPVFLSLLFALTGGTYLAAIIFQVILFSSALIACFYLLRNRNEKYAVAFFLACLSLWLPSTQFLFLTENLGAILLIVSFGFLWRGVSDGCSKLYGTGLFLLSLSFSARPWAAGCLLTLPLLPFIINQQFKYKAKQFVFFSFMIVSGLAINFIVSALFATPTTASNYPQTLYGLVSNTLSWRAASLDPVIAQHMQEGTAPALLNTIIYQRCWEIFIANPLLLLFSLREVYILYFREIPSAFAYNTYLYPVMMVLWFILVSKKYEKINKIRCLLLLLPAVLNLGSFVFMFLACYGIFLLFTKRLQNSGVFGLLYMLGILVSLPLVGIDGGSRVKIASDIFLFFLCAFGLQHFLHPIQELGVTGFNDKQRNVIPLAALSVCFVSFVFFPSLIFLNGKQQHEYIAQKSLLVQETERLPLQVPLPDALSNLELDTIGKKWPAPSYETVDGKAACQLIRYTDRDALFLDPKQWVSVQLAEFWPMGKFDPPMARTVHVRSWCIFPNIGKESLKKFDNSHIYVAGKIIGRPRGWKYDTGYALLVTYIGVPTKDGAVTWHEVPSLDIL